MKQMLTVFFLISLLNAAIAQTSYTPIGHWRWIDGSDTIDFKLKTDVIVVNSTTSYNVIIGFHRYIKNGVTVENTLADYPTNYNARKFSLILSGNGGLFSSAHFDGMTMDSLYKESGEISFKKINPTTIEVNLTKLQGVRLKAPPALILPRHFILTKL